MYYDLIELFPVPILKFSLGRNLTSSEMSFVRNLKKENNLNNEKSIDSNILQNTELEELDMFFKNCLDIYLNKIYKPKNKVNVYITQSWANYTSKYQSHHKHNHPNSIISGVFYVKSDSKTDKLFFFKEDLNILQIDASEYDMYNSASWWLPAEENTLLLFPSYLYHAVQPVEHDETRISISFNSFLKGKVGNEKIFTELNL